MYINVVTFLMYVCIDCVVYFTPLDSIQLQNGELQIAFYLCVYCVSGLGDVLPESTPPLFPQGCPVPTQRPATLPLGLQAYFPGEPI